jgi:outer membrane protein OmpA-like peptidoglycan-associated protein
MAEDKLTEATLAAETCLSKTSSSSIPLSLAPAVIRIELATATATALAVKPVPVNFAAPMPAKIAQEPMTLQSIILFNFDKRDMNSVVGASKSSLDEMITKLQSPDISVNRITVIGHADRMNIAKAQNYNAKLAYDRAEAAKAYLISKRVEANRISLLPKVDNEQIETCNAKFKTMQELQHCLASNRRVEVMVDAVRQK